MVVLDEGAWSAYPCDTRVWFIYFGYFLFFFASPFVLFLAVKLKRILGQKPLFSLGPHIRVGRRGRCVMLGAWGVVSVCLVFNQTFQREMDWRKMDQNTFVETGCQGRMPYELRIPRDEITIGYRWREHRRGNHQELSINWKQYRAVINLDSSRYLANLARFAPQQMQVYVNDLLRNGKPVPVALR